MTIYRTAYDTTLGKALSVDKTIQEIKKSLIRDGDTRFNLNLITSVIFLPMAIEGNYSFDTEIPLFGHPLVIEKVKDKNYLVLDTRLFTKFNTTNGAREIKNVTEHDFAVSRYILNFALLNDGIGQIKNSLFFAGIVYCQWLAEVISKRFALDPKDQMLLTIVTHMYYQSLFYDNAEHTDEFKQLLVNQAMRATGYPSSVVSEVASKIKPMSNIESLCDNIVAVLENIRLNHFDAAVLVNIVAMSWYGLNSKENITIALEHLPTWIAICYASITSRTYKYSTIAKIAEKYGKKGKDEEFLKNYLTLVKSYQTKPSIESINFKNDILIELEKVEF